MAQGTGRTAMANGNIEPYHTVMIDTTVDNRVIQGVAGSKCIGISGKGTRYAPWTPLDDGYFAIAGELCQYWAIGEENVPAVLGGTVTTERRLMSDVNGALTPVTADGDFFIAIARMTGVAGEIIPVDVVYGQAAS